jgi:hypothetical protein
VLRLPASRQRARRRRSCLLSHNARHTCRLRCTVPSAHLPVAGLARVSLDVIGGTILSDGFFFVFFLQAKKTQVGKWVPVKSQVGMAPPSDQWALRTRPHPSLIYWLKHLVQKKNDAVLSNKKTTAYGWLRCFVEAIRWSKMLNRRGGELAMHQLYL